MSYQETLSYLFGLQKFGIKFGLTNISRLLEILENPQNSLKAVHIAGTNGKGSTASTIASILKESAYRVGLYTSPHLESFTERISINGSEIEEERVVQLTERMRSAIQDSIYSEELGNITFFEFTTAMAMLYFLEEGVDVAVMETGMGGRLDATNVITPLVSVITNISIEHKEFLGNTIEEIANEKAGIIKEGVPVLTGVKHPSALKVIENRCHEKAGRLFRLGIDFDHRKEGNGIFSYNGIKENIDHLRINLAGSHQFDNASLSIATIELLRNKGLMVPKEAIRSGIGKVIWPGRLETVSQNPLIILDGAHNPAGAEVLAESIANDMKFNKLFLIIGVMADKDIEAIMSPLAPLAHELILSRPRYERASSAAGLLPFATKYNKNSTVFEDLREAINYVRVKAADNDLIVISGSLFTVGEARAIILH